jgi:hypothetical protein
VSLPNLNFIQGDATDITNFGKFDVFFVSGLLYHLDKPRRFLEDVAANCGKALVLWTHVTQAEENQASGTYTLSELCENEGILGRWYSEHGDIPQAELDELRWASWDNKKSFWIQKEYLLQLLKDIGFDLVLEQFDCMDDIVSDMTQGFYRKIDRVMLVAIKSGLPIDRSDASSLKRPLPVKRPSKTEQTATQPCVLIAEQQLANAQATVRAMQASTSWRLTAPIRKIGILLGRGRRGPL